MNQVIDGTMIAAQLRRSLFGQLTFEGVTVRRANGEEVRIGRVAVAADLREAMTPGRSGRFFFHNVAGARGLHGFAPTGETPRGAFPRLVEDMFGAMTMVNLVMLATLLTVDGSMRLLPALMAALGATLWMLFAASRQGAMHDFRFAAGLAKGSGRSAAQRPRHQLV